MNDYEKIIESCKKKCRYGDLWKEFSVDELIEYGFIKAKRGKILYSRQQKEYAIDDIKDVINILIFSLLRIEYNNNNK